MKVFSPELSFNQPKATRVCIRSINQSNRSISVRVLFLSCLRKLLYDSRDIRELNLINFDFGATADSSGGLALNLLAEVSPLHGF